MGQRWVKDVVMVEVGVKEVVVVVRGVVDPRLGHQQRSV